MEGNHVFGSLNIPAERLKARLAAPAVGRENSLKDYTQAMTVAIAFYLFGHVADLATTVSFLHLGQSECNFVPALVLQHGGLPALIALKVIGSVLTAWVLWRLRNRVFTVVFTCALAVLLIYIASINSLDVLEGLMHATAG